MKSKVIIGAICLMLLVSMVAEAKKKRGKGGGLLAAGAAKVYSANVMSESKVYTCISIEKTVASQESMINNANEKFEIILTNWEKLGEEIDKDDKTLDLTSQYEVDKYNEKVESYNKQRELLLIEEERINKLDSEYGNNIDEYNNNCVGKRFYLEDLETAESRLSFKSTLFRSE